MAKLLEFKKDESELFEALSVIFFVADQPTPSEVKASIKAEDILTSHGVETTESKFKTVNCSFCGQRIMKTPRILTLQGSKGADLILEDKVFEYISGRFEKWQQVTDPAMKRPFEALRERFESAKGNKDLDDLDKIHAYIAARDKTDTVKTATQS